MPTLNTLIPEELIVTTSQHPPESVNISSVSCDSRQITPGALFFAIRGSAQDGTRFVEEAITKGAAAIVVEGKELPELSIPSFGVNCIRKAISEAAARYENAPTKELRMIGVTGTNGKTSTAWIISQALARLGESTALMGTLGKGEIVLETGEVSLEETLNSTPGPLEIHGYLRQFLAHGGKNAVLEATSQGIEQERTSAVHWDAAVFTNLTRDHLDAHGTLEEYARQKKRLFLEELASSHKPERIAVINAADPVGNDISRELPGDITCYRYHMHSDSADAFPTHVSGSMQRTLIEAMILGERASLDMRLIGNYNVENTLAAALTLRALGYATAALEEAFRRIPPVLGRLELLAESSVHVFVDYSHTPDALRSVLSSLRPLAEARIITVFGCGGDRDRGKRPLMAEAVARLSDYGILTSDNPRNEDPERIIDDAIPGFNTPNAYEGFQWEAVVRREEAIYRAVRLAQAGDCVLIAGKGHEDYQETKGVRHPFSDQLVARQALKDCGLT